MEKKMILMCADMTVAESYRGRWDVKLPRMLPIGLDLVADRIPDVFLTQSLDIVESSLPDSRRNVDVEKMANLMAANLYRQDQMNIWLAGRVLSIDRAYAKKVLNALQLSQAQDRLSKASVSLAFHALSLRDNYWVRFSDDDEMKWSDVDLRKNSLSKAIALIALSGTSMTLTIKNIRHTAEVSTLGSYAKGWFRDEGGQLWLYKTKGPESDEVEREVCASNVIDCFNVYGNLKYELAEMNGVKCSRCKLMSSEDRFVVHAADLDKWCMRSGTNVADWTKKNYPQQYAQMITIDYLIANSDRHMWNWGFYQDAESGRIISPHELYDHNNAFDPQLLGDESWMSIVETGKTMKEAAMFWVKRSGLRLLRKPTKKMFPNARSYEVFVGRCKHLGLWETVESIPKMAGF